MAKLDKFLNFHYLSHPMKSQKKAYSFALAAIACWSTIGSAFKISLKFLDPLALLLIASLVACIVLFIILMIQRKISLLRNLSLKDLRNSAILGFLNPFLYYVVLLEAYDILKAQEAGTLNYIWPVFLVLISIPILGQKISLKSIAAILISFSGILLISLHPETVTGEPGSGINGDRLRGIVLAVGSALLWALYWIYNLKDERETVSKLFLNFVFGFFYTLIMVIVTGDWPAPSWQGYTSGIYVGIFEMGLTFVLWLYALQYSSTTAKVSNLIYLSPFISLIFIHFVVGEAILISTVAGLIMIISGIIIQQYLRR